MQTRLQALDRVQAVIEFDLAGNVLTANQNFLATLGYSLGEIVGKHHSRFVPQGYEATPEYQAFWDRLRAGEFQTGQYMRIAKSGKEVWIEASYNPVLGRNGQPTKIIKFATDISRQKAEDAERAGLVEAIRKVQAVIEFTLEGMVLDANQNFLSVLGFTLPEIQGRHHAMFVAPDYKTSADYTAFWAKLKRGEFQTGQYRRIGKNGKEIWIQASYNPIFDAAGRPYKVVKFATDITDQVTMLAKLQRLIDQNFSQIDQALARSTTESGAAVRVVESTSESVQTMAAAAEELAASVDEISASMAKSKIATDSAFENVRAAGDFTKSLSDAASSMGGIVGLIQNIAGQINLLALNATIESARAGEAGRGFAVVAQEVKNLANQAAKATDQIGGEINGVQSISSDVVKALEAILKSVEIMRGNVVATSAAVEEQSVVTRDMSSNMQSAARDVAAISGNIAAISTAVTEVSNAVTTTREAAKVLAR